MNVTLPLDRMTTAENLSVMRAPWQDLSHNADQFESPAWLEEVLHEREKRFKESRETYVDWEGAKAELHKPQL